MRPCGRYPCAVLRDQLSLCESAPYCVIDWADQVILFAGTLDECERVQDENYGGLTVMDTRHLADWLTSANESPATRE